MRRTLFTALVTVFLSACGDTAGQDPGADRVTSISSSLSAAEVNAVYRAVLGVAADDVIHPDHSNPVDRNMAILRDRIDPQLQGSNVERNMEDLRRRIDPLNTAL